MNEEYELTVGERVETWKDNAPNQHGIDAGFEEFLGHHPFIHCDMLKYDLPHVLRIAYLAGLSDGIDKAASVYRSMVIADDPDELKRRIANSTVPEQLAENLERLDVTG